MGKDPQAFRTISEVADMLDVPQHVLRFWESKFTQVKPMKRAGGRRYYRPNDIKILIHVKSLLYSEGYTIKGVQKLLKQKRNPVNTQDKQNNLQSDNKIQKQYEKQNHRQQNNTANELKKIIAELKEIQSLIKKNG